MANPINNTGKSFDELSADYVNNNQANNSDEPPQTIIPDNGFDLNAYFARKLGDGASVKADAVRNATAEKRAKLEQDRAAIAASTQQVKDAQVESAKAWTKQIGLDTNNLVGQGINNVASFVSGASRQVVGALAALPTTLKAANQEFQASDSDIEAYNRYMTGTASEADLTQLNRKVQQPSAIGAKASMNALDPNAPTVVSLLNNAYSNRQTSRKITNTFDVSSIVDSTNRQNLDDSLGENFQSSVDQITSGWNAGRKGEYKDALVSISKGVGNLLANTGEAAITNPAAVSEYVSENIPQLFVGAIGKVGRPLMTATNIGYAADFYNQGIENYQKANEGKLPSKDEMAKIGAWATSLALAEHLGDSVTLASVLGKQVAGKGVKNVAKAVVNSGIGEAATEGYQGYAEDVTSGKRKADDFSNEALFNIYQNAVIGGLSGAVLGGGGRAIAEATRSTPEQIKADEETASAKEEFANAAKTNDPSIYLNQDSDTYNPSKAVGVLFAHNTFEDTSTETRKANLIQASKIADQLEEQRSVLVEAYGLAENSNKAAIKQKINNLDTQITQVENLFDGISAQQETAPAPKEQVQEQVAAVQENTEQAPEIADKVINLSMRNTENLSVEDAQALAGNPENALSQPQRDYLNAYAASRESESELSNMSEVSQEVLYGSKNNLGIAQVRQRVGNAIAADNQQLASRQVELLTSFADDHASKAAAATQAIKENGLGAQIVKTDTGWAVPSTTLTPRQLKAQKGMTLNSARLVQNIQIEAQALQNAKEEISQAVALHFSKDAPILSVSQKQDNLAPEINLVDKRLKGEEQSVESDLSTAEPTPQNQTPLQSEATQQQDVAQAKSPVVEDATTEEVGHPLFKEKTQKGESKSFQEQNLVAEHFNQKQVKESDASSRPLVSVPNFIKVFYTFSDFLKDKEVSEQQHTMLSHFQDTVMSWFETIDENTVEGSKDYRYTDMSQFLMVNGKFDENTKTAIGYAAYSWLAENASRSLFNTDSEINAILNKDDDALVSTEASDLLRNVGTRQNVIVNSLGRKVLQSLGLNAGTNAPMNLQADLEASIGAHVMKLMLDEGILTRTIIPGAKFAELLNVKDAEQTKKFAGQAFIKVANKDGEINTKAKEVVAAMKGTHGLLDKLFGAEEGMKDPSNTKIPFTQQSPRNTDQKVPASEATIMKHENAQPSYIRQDLWNLAGQLHMDNFLAIAGFESINEAVTHIVNQKSIQAKNDGLMREYLNMMDYFGVTQSEDRMNDPLYFDHVVWKQQRVGIATNTINPQTSKIHRHMLYRPTWDVEVNLNDRAMVENFKLRVAEGLGIKTDKQDNAQSLIDVSAAIQKPEIKNAINALRKSITEGGLTMQDQKAIVDGVNKAGEAMQSLDALMGVAHYLEAIKTNKPSFKTQLMSEVDGVTNGPMLSHLLMGAAPDVDTLFKLLNRGGFYTVESGEQNYNVWRSKVGNQDLYETTAAHMIDNLKNLGFDQTTMNAIWTFTGTLANDDKQSVKERRNIVKTPLTAMIFGSAVEGAVDSMADNFVKAVYAKLEDVAAGKAELSTVINSMNQLGMNINPNASIKELMGKEFTKEQIANLKGVFTETIGEAVKSTMKQDFATFIEQRRSFNISAQLSFDLYNAIYTGLREDRINQLVKEGKIPTNKTTGKPMHDLTRAQESALRKEIQSVMPIMHTAFSQKSGDLSGGILASKSASKISEDPLYQNQVKFGKPFPDGPSSVKVAGMERSETAPGVAMAPMSVHSLDSYISHMAAMKSEVLNIHDAHGAGLANFQQAAINLNQSTWNAMMEYSPASQMADMLERVITGVAGLLDSGRLNEATQAQLQQVMANYAKQLKVSPKAVLDVQMHAAKDLAYRADDMKLQALELMGSVDQYALQGGNYQVTEEDRVAASNKRKNLSQNIGNPAQAALATLSGLASGKVVPVAQNDPDLDPSSLEGNRLKENKLSGPGPYNSPWGDLGAPHMDSNQALVDEFNATPVMNGTQALRALRSAMSTQPTTRSSQFVARLLNLVEKTMPANLTVQMLTPATPYDQVLAKGAEKSRGWYVAKGDQNQINLLSPDFKYSGLTPEVLAHELVHATLAQTVQAELDVKAKDPSYKSDALDLVNELDSLRSKALEFVNKSNMKGYGPALENVHEFMAWGMTNLDFQRNVLNKIEMASKTTSNKFITGMKKFIDTLVDLLFKGSNKSNKEIEQNGMAIMIANVSGLYYVAAQTKSKADLVLNAANNGQPNINAYSTMDIYDGLVNTNTPISSTFQIQLKSLLQGIVDQLHGPNGSFKESLMQNKALTPSEVFAQAMVSGQAPFASEILASNFRISEQEAYVLEQVEAVMKASLNDNASHTTAGYEQLAKLYKEAQNKIKPENFHKGNWATATQIEKDEAQAKHDFLFKLNQKADGTSDYLARFAAMVLAHEDTANLMSFATDVRTKRDLAGLSLTEKIHQAYDAILGWLNGQFTSTYEGQAADEKLTTLVKNLVDIEAKKTMKISQQRNQTLEYLDNLVYETSKKTRDAVEKFGKKAFFTASNNGYVRALGSVTGAVASGRVGLIMQGISDLRDEHFRESHGLFAGIINEIQGSKEDNIRFHQLNRLAKKIEGTRKDIITNITKFIGEAFDNGGEYLGREHKAAISQMVLRSDAASLLSSYTTKQAINFMVNESARNTEIGKLTATLGNEKNFGNLWVKQAKLLAYYKAQGRVAGANLMFNAANIAKLYGTVYANRIDQQTIDRVTPVIDHLVTLYSMEYATSTHKQYIKDVVDAETARTDGNGLEFTMLLHKELQQESKDRLFTAGEPLLMKGYLPEAFNPYIEIKAANELDGELLEKQGFVQGPQLNQDDVDPNKEIKHLYALRDGGLQSYLSGNISLTARGAKGTKVSNNLFGQQKTDYMKQVGDAKAKLIKDDLKFDPTFDPRKVGGNHLAPVLNAVGDIVDYRYMMSEAVKDAQLERNNDFDTLMGIMAGSIFDKDTSVSHNDKVIQALKAQYDEEYATRHHSYLKVGKDSPDPKLREIWQMIPYATKQSIKKIWGSDNMMVRVDLLDINFGYRKLSIADTFTIDEADRNALQRVIYEVGTFFFDEKARLRFKQAEDIWQALVREAKDTMVVKSGITLLGNITSNLTLLSWAGVSVPDIIRHHRVAMKGALAYRKDSESLERIKLQLSTGYLPQNTVAELTREKVILEDALKRNPVSELIDAGMMPTIVEDVAGDDDAYSFKGRFSRKVDEYVNNLNPHIVNTAKTLMIAHDTPLYKALSYGTQLSDFVARYTLYKHVTERKRDPMQKKEALQFISDAFINYDIPSHRLVQYANDMGMVFFTKYFLRIQKVIAQLYKDNPGRAIMLLTMSNFFSTVPTVLDSAAIHHLGNPFSTGAVKYVTTLDQMATVNALMTPFK